MNENEDNINRLHFIFNNPGQIRIRSRVENTINYCNTKTDIWKWNDGGDSTSINWENYNYNKELKDILQAYILHRLESKSPQTVISCDIPFLKYISKHEYGKDFPLPVNVVIAIFIRLSQENICAFFGFKMFYQWAIERKIYGFSKKIYDEIDEIQLPKRNPYQRIYLNPTYISVNEENRILKYLENTDTLSYEQYRNNVLVHLVYELGPRPIQIFSISQSDIEIIKNDQSDEVFFTLWLAMAKKISSTVLVKKPRKISNYLGKKIQHLIQLNSKRYLNNDALFRDINHPEARLSKSKISFIIINELSSIGFDKWEGATYLRHHLAQSLANQGASAEVIAEILGHNSTLPARAYIAATPEIAIIKTKALGKLKTYENIMKMLLTGEIVKRNSISKSQWVRGMVGSQYIGGIGSCGLPNNTSCPKNPVYSCYTCHKFQPFADGNHEDVKQGLHKQAQYFIDIAEKAMDLEYNRAVLQLEKTIQAVDAVIERCKTYNSINNYEFTKGKTL
ncbi:MAG TPA: tyrosine-type recombinase/integrase [Verrucomicrobiae bacterium]|nr:tyrosine-type recombinase/integrase [Verrucomicrobiae bacterium]